MESSEIVRYLRAFSTITPNYPEDLSVTISVSLLENMQEFMQLAADRIEELESKIQILSRHEVKE